jgi:hypothetical protein
MVHGLYFEREKIGKQESIREYFGENIKNSEIINPIRGIFSFNLQSKIKGSVLKRKNNSFVN